MISRREVSSREVVAAHLARIDEVDPHLNAVVRRWDDDSVAAADAADRAVGAGDLLGALHGVPVTIKENIDLAGTPTTQAIAFLAEAVSATDAPLVQRVRGAGAIPIGRTNLPALGRRVTTESSLHGVTRNPWNPARRMADGLPVGAQLVGRRFAELTCLNASEVSEQAFGTITPIDPIR